METYKTLKWNIYNGIGHLVLNQPPANAMTKLFFVEFNQLTSRLPAMKELSGMIIYGQGRHFSSGADINELSDSISENSKMNNKGVITYCPANMHHNLESMRIIGSMAIPVVAAISGVCLGSAFELALFCHFRISTGNAVLGLPESTYGLMPGLGGIQQLRKITAKATAMDLVFKGSTFCGKNAFDFGVVDRIVKKDHLLDSAVRLAEIASKDFRYYNKKEYLHQLDRNT